MSHYINSNEQIKLLNISIETYKKGYICYAQRLNYRLLNKLIIFYFQNTFFSAIFNYY